MIKIDNIFVNYGQFQALHGISMEIRDGEIVALLGSNGAGKTTTINTISGICDVMQGDILLDGESIKNITPNERVARGIVQSPEGRKLFPFMTVEDNLIVGSYLKHAKAKRAESLERCYDLFPKLKERRKQLAGTMSGGEQQMCAIARAMMSCPKVLMLDEPSLGLAPVVVDDILKAIVDINKAGTTILLVEQNVMASLEIANRAYVIEQGMNVMDGEANVLMDNDDLRKAYLGI